MDVRKRRGICYYGICYERFLVGVLPEFRTFRIAVTVAAATAAATAFWFFELLICGRNASLPESLKHFVHHLPSFRNLARLDRLDTGNQTLLSSVEVVRWHETHDPPDS